jgi:ATPase subunit of ABC transporter with duplicated ATPase domains
MLLGDKINSVSKFLLKNNNLIDNNYEQILKIRDIELNKNIYIQEIIEEKKEEKIEQEKPKKTYKIFINNKNSGPKKCSPDFSLIDLKQLLVQKFDDDEEGIFLLKQTEGEINLEEESNYTIEEIAKNGNVYIITKKVDPETKEFIEFVPNKPIDGSNFIKNMGQLKIYEYPYGKMKFDDPNCHTIIVLGETGSGKTTLLNALINYCVGIDYKDDFRYYIINENTGKSNYLSQTSTVNVYYIKSWSIL